MDIDLRRFGEIPPADRSSWDAAVAKALGSLTLERLRTVTTDGIAIPTLAAPRADRTATSGRPAGVAWSIVQRVPWTTPETINAQILDEIAAGADAIDLILPVPPSTEAAAWADAEDYDRKLVRVFEGVYLDMITVHFTGDFAALHIAKRLPQIVPSFDGEGKRLRLHLGLDPVVDAIRTYSDADINSTNLKGAFRSLGDVDAGGFDGTLLASQGQYWHALGASEVQQLAIAIATVALHIDLWADEPPTDLDFAQLPARIEIRLVADQNQFLTVAKIRAMRRLWALLLDAWGLPQVPAFIHAEPAWRMMSRRDPHVNVLRSTVAAFAAAVGGADAITTVPHTAVLGTPDADARRLSRNIQTVLMDESNLHRVADPAAGSGTVEDLTDELAAAAWAAFQEIDGEGGLLASWRSGALPARIAASDARQREAVARRRIPITGTSTYPLLAERSATTIGPDAWRAPAPGATRLAEPWEALRDRSDAILAATGRRPRVFLAALGPVAAYTARATWAKNLFEAGGIEAVVGDGAADPAALVQAFAASGARIACLCSDDATYATLGRPAAAALAAAGAATVLLAGRPKEGEADLTAAGVGRFVHEGLDMLALLGELHDLLGMPERTST